MKRLLFSFLLLCPAGLQAAETKITGDAALASSAAATVPDAPGFNQSSTFASTPIESAPPRIRMPVTSPVLYGGFYTYSVWSGRCEIANVATGGCSCPGGYAVRYVDDRTSGDRARTFKYLRSYICERRR